MEMGKTGGDGEGEAVKDFARVELMDSAVERGVPYYKLIAADIVVADGFSEEELLEMACRLNSAVSARVRPLVEACQDLIETAESYAMQTYDRSGVTRKKIEAADKALESLQ